ncbi:MAG: hypothetical protein LQ350_005234 [Teloschistes chrysophthalmus]|nr:MAG: hypothetical protein LQ350_005234 [Niorma chrysophthalma]
MATLPKPDKPLKILTIDGGGLQAISSLLILDTLLKEIARNNKVAGSKPRPCDVFDVIAGIGSGGWLALLLGRFQMDVSAALAEWYNLIECIAPRTKAEEIRMRLRDHTYFHTDRLLEQIDQLTDFYETERHMFFQPPDSTRCKHVFVCALKTNSKGKHLGYHLYRTYHCPDGAKVLDGPDPSDYNISHAFGVTGAAKYFTRPWKETSTRKVKSKFMDIQFPCPHNITELALDEMWGLYGTHVPISVVVNIGPGIPNASDCRNIARRFSWDTKPPSRITVRQDSTESLPSASDRDSESTTIPHRKTFGSVTDVDFEKKLQRRESQIERDIKSKLHNVYNGNPPPYHRLAPPVSAPRAAQNDTCTPKTTHDATKQYLQSPWVEKQVEEVSNHFEAIVQFR